MNAEVELPDDVIAELKANRKVNAIKLLRTHQGIDLKEAKDLVDVYVEQHPTIADHQPPGSDSGIGRIVVLIIGVCVIFGIYKYFT